MGFRFRKSINLGGGVRLNIGKRGVGISAGVKGFRVSANSRGVRTTASIPGTGISYTEHHSFKNNRRPSTQRPSSYNNVQSNASVAVNTNPFFSPKLPNELKSKHYNLQTISIFLGFIMVLSGFAHSIMFVLGFGCIFGAGRWRTQTDWVEQHYLKSLKNYKRRNYNVCISELDKVLEHPNASKDLNLVKAECYNNLGNKNMVYEIYKGYFENVNLSTLSAPEYWSYKGAAVEILVNHKDFDLALNIAQSLPEGEMNGFDLSLWKNYFKGVCFLGKDQYEVALECFKNAVGRKRSMVEPYINSHYFMGIIYNKLGKQDLAKKKFEKVYATDPGYKNISEIMEAVEAGDTLNISFR